MFKKDHPNYRIWVGIKQRCLNPKCTGYENYGGRGITICDRWMSFEAFNEDMGVCPSKDFSIERIENNEGYCKGNCKWATDIEQNRNRRNNRHYKGRLVVEVAQENNLRPQTIYARLRLGWNQDEAIKTPLLRDIDKSEAGDTLRQRIKDASIQLNMTESAIRNRIRVHGWTIEKALTTPRLRESTKHPYS